MLPALAHLSLKPKVIKTDAPIDDSARRYWLNALRQRSTLWGAPLEILNDRKFMLKAVREDGEALQFASVDLKNDREVVLAAVTEDADAFAYASGELQNDPEVRLAAATSGEIPNLVAMASIINDLEEELKVLLPNTAIEETETMRSKRMERLEAISDVLDRLAAVRVEPGGMYDSLELYKTPPFCPVLQTSSQPLTARMFLPNVHF